MSTAFRFTIDATENRQVWVISLFNHTWQQAKAHTPHPASRIPHHPQLSKTSRQKQKTKSLGNNLDSRRLRPRLKADTRYRALHS